MGRLDAKVAIITSAGSGNGRGIALRFAEDGADVVVADVAAVATFLASDDAAFVTGAMVTTDGGITAGAYSAAAAKLAAKLRRPG